MSKPTQEILRASFDASVTIEAGKGEGDSPATFSVGAYTGGALRLSGIDLPVVVDLASLKYARHVRANLDHDNTKRVGHVTTKTNDGKTLTLGGVFSAATSHRDEVVASAKQQYDWEASIEASPGKLTPVRKGQSVSVNGQTFTGPIYVARDYTLTAFAFLSHGADTGNTVSIAAEAALPSKEKNMDQGFSTWLEARGWNVDALPEGKDVELKAKYDAEIAPPVKAAKATSIDEIVAAQEAENLREERITEIAAKFMGKYKTQTRSIQARANQAIEAKSDPDRFELDMRREFDSDRPQGPGIHIRGNDRINETVIEAAVCQAGRLRNIEKYFDDQTLQAAKDEFDGDIGLNQMFIEFAKMNGYRPRNSSVRVTAEVHNAAFKFDPELRASFSTMSVPGILSATANKFLLDGWGGGDMAWQDITGRKSVKNFQTHTSYRLSGTMKYAKVGAGGELTHGTVSESTYDNKVDTYGRMFSITRTDLINDDLGALTAVPRELGNGANESFNEVFWTEFLNNTTSFFHTNNANVSTGAGSALGIVGLTNAEVAHMAQTKPNGQPLGVLPSILLVPPALYRTALALMAAPTVVSTTTANTPLPDANTFSGNYKVVTSPYMSNSAYTGSGSAVWYTLVDPSRYAVIETAFLNGKDSPVIEQAEAAFNVLGVQMRAYHDFGCNLQEPRGGVRSAGS